MIMKTEPYLDEDDADHNNEGDDDHERLDDLADTNIDVDWFINTSRRSPH